MTDLMHVYIFIFFQGRQGETGSLGSKGDAGGLVWAAFKSIILVFSVSTVTKMEIKHGRPSVTTRGELKIQRAAA